MKEVIKNFPKQFSFQPKIENGSALAKKKFNSFVLDGMGGSHLAADLLKAVKPELDIYIYSNYGLPSLPKEKLKKSLFVASSYSGNTEEPLDALDLAIKAKLSVAAIAVGGKLLKIAKEKKLPYIQLPKTGIQPRQALGFQIRGLLKLFNDKKALSETRSLSNQLDPEGMEKIGRELAKKISGKIPIIYSSAKNYGLAYIWKIKFNENSKIPAFYNVFPELNHNEMNGFDLTKKAEKLGKNFHFIFLKDLTDLPRIQKRMVVTQRIYKNKGLPVEVLTLKEKNRWQAIFNNLLIADWTSYYLALNYGADPEKVPPVEKFKKMIG